MWISQTFAGGCYDEILRYAQNDKQANSPNGINGTVHQAINAQNDKQAGSPNGRGETVR